MGFTLCNVIITMDADNMYLQIGPEGFSFDKNQLKQIALGEIKTPEFLLVYMAMECWRNNIDINKSAQIKSYIEGRKWPW